jgi:hypothetical protein
LKNPAAAKPFLNIGNKLNAAIEASTEILSKQSTDTPKSEDNTTSPQRVSDRTLRSPRGVNNAQEGSPGSPQLANDQKLAFSPKITPQLPVRGLNENFSMREPAILNSIKKTTSTSKKLVNNNNINDNNINNISGVDIVTPGEENSPRRRLRKRIIPKPQKLTLNTTVYKFF